MLRRLEDKGRGAVERHAARGGGVGAVAGVEAQRVEGGVLACHLALMDCQRAHFSAAIGDMKSKLSVRGMTERVGGLQYGGGRTLWFTSCARSGLMLAAA